MEEALRLFRQYKDSVYRLALSFTGSVQDAEDVTQTVFLKLLETKPALEAGRERTWLCLLYTSPGRRPHPGAGQRPGERL